MAATTKNPAYGPTVPQTTAHDGASAAGASAAQRMPAASDDAEASEQAEAAARAESVYRWLDAHGIRYSHYSHEASPTIELAMRHWRQDGSRHCKNLFFRNHKGDRHYLVCFDCEKSLAIHELEHRLHQGKLSFASPERMMRCLGLTPGSVSPFGLINDTEHRVHLFLDANLRRCDMLGFHPNDCRATVVISREEFERYLSAVGCTYEYTDLY